MDTNKQSKQVPTEDTNILQFVKHLSEKNYAEANKYLQASLEGKMMNRMREVPKDTRF
jgi:hypothetical protein